MLDHGSLYILRHGSLEFKYECPAAKDECGGTKGKDWDNGGQISDKRGEISDKKSPNLADYVNCGAVSYKRIVLNEGAIICP